MSETNEDEHPAVVASKRSIDCVAANDKEAWLALYAEDAVVCDPVGVSPMDPTGEGHRGKAAISAFWDSTIGPANVSFEVSKRWISGERACCVAQVARSELANGAVTECDMLAVYHINEDGLIQSMSAYWDFDAVVRQLADATS